MKSVLLPLIWVMMSVLSYSQYTYEYAFAPEKWSIPAIVTELKNTYAEEPFISSDGKTLFLSSGRYVVKTDTGWSKVKELGPQINGNLMRNACISPDSKLLVFTWWYYGGWELFYSEWDSLKQDWGAAKWGGYELNNEEYEISCSFPNDTTMIYLKDGYTSISFWNKRTKTWSAAKLWPAETPIYS